MYIGFWCENQMRKDHYEDKDVGRSVILNGSQKDRIVHNMRSYLSEIGSCIMDWINLAQYRDRWSAVAYTLMKLQIQ
jgi:hypothetical protein